MGNLAYSVIATTLDLMGVPNSIMGSTSGCPGFTYLELSGCPEFNSGLN